MRLPIQILIYLIVGAGFGSPQVAHAIHPYHVSSAEVRWNSHSGNFEVALCVWPTDLEQAISKQTSQPVDLNRMAGLDESLETYVSQRFFIRPVDSGLGADHGAEKNASVNELSKPGDRRGLKNIRWVGSEIGLKQAWLYFEVPGGDLSESWQIENRVFYELNADQINQIQLTVESQVDSIALDRKESVHQFSTKRLNTND